MPAAANVRVVFALTLLHFTGDFYSAFINPLWWLLTGRGAGLFAGAFAAGFAVLASLPLGVTMAQQLAPRARSMVSSLMMGLAHGLGGSLTPLVGWLADRHGIHQVLSVVALVPLATVVLVFFLPSIRSAR